MRSDATRAHVGNNSLHIHDHWRTVRSIYTVHLPFRGLRMSGTKSSNTATPHLRTYHPLCNWNTPLIEEHQGFPKVLQLHSCSVCWSRCRSGTLFRGNITRDTLISVVYRWKSDKCSNCTGVPFSATFHGIRSFPDSYAKCSNRGCSNCTGGTYS